ncbi:unnamed protein product [Bursaphelenchus xylophilus]|uniref:(pine wood nematode) hypothetical protein n=1 Tax=Bursaphelenchus xylophilus TaxID=6326 RepID=A0A1I7SQU2_BURXY|nr:unnamed protein product [Bursaphelenchus xylophilus]CAG9110388.1 unnamed protein product [Bursaphelenchus xylophilus]
MLGRVILLGLAVTVTAKDVLPADCHCRDWYGGCRQQGDGWVDDFVWAFRCNANDGSPAEFTGCMLPDSNQVLPVGANQTIDGFWHSCDANQIRLKYEQEPKCVINGTITKHVGEKFRDGIFNWLCLETGRWVKGCYYQNETNDWVLLGIGQFGYNGLVKHTCDLYKDNPGVVQYHAQVRDDIPHKSPPNKGINQNLPHPYDNRLKQEPVKWLHENAKHFIANDNKYIAVIRYLPASLKINRPQFL